ncbi:MAG: hypothetical protein ABJH04_08035 [Cyclobacteriaceae bacterium]
MGATQFHVTQRGMSMAEAYKEAKDESRFENGHDSYAGTIGASHGFTDVTAAFKGLKGKAFETQYDKYMDRADKFGPCFGICIKEPKKNSNKIKSKVTHTVSKGAKKWELVYEIREQFGHRFIGKEKTKGKAVEVGRAHCEKTTNSVIIRMAKKLADGNTEVATIDYKKSTSESTGKYIFFGEAPC